MKTFFAKCGLFVLISIFVGYFSLASILRYQKLLSNYFDLGIMHQTAYNTFRAIQTDDYSRFLELTNPHGPQQFNRIAVHADVTIAIIALLYFMYASPATLVIAQAVIVGSGAWLVYLIARHELHGYRAQYALSFVFALLYLMQPALQRIVLFDFHAVSLAMTSMLMLIYFGLKRKYMSALLACVFSLLCKEQIGLSVTVLGVLMMMRGRWHALIKHIETRNMRAIFHAFKRVATTQESRLWMIICVVSLGWFVYAMFYLIPHFRQDGHFALERYDGYGDSSGGILLGILLNPLRVAQIFFIPNTWEYVVAIFAPFGFLSFLSPIVLATVPEAAINLLSNSASMKSINFHYTAVFHPIVAYSAILGCRTLLGLLSDAKIPFHDVHTRHHHKYFTPLAHLKKLKKQFVLTNSVMRFLGMGVLFGVGLGANVWFGPLPYARKPEAAMFYKNELAKEKLYEWAYKLKNEHIKVSTTSTIAPYFTARRYFYNFSETYTRADYIVIKLSTIDDNPYTSYKPRTEYEALKKDRRYRLIDVGEDLEVYRKVASESAR